MITNGGPHPPEKWADMTLRPIADLIVIEPTAPVQAAVDKSEFEAALFRLLVDLHQQMQRHERDMLREHGDARLSAPFDDAHDRAGYTASRISELAQRLPRFAAHFDKPEVRAAVYAIAGQHFSDSMQIERSWHADKNRTS